MRRVFILSTLVTLLAISIGWTATESFKDYNRKIPAQVCALKFDTSGCYYAAGSSTTHRVGKEVTTLRSLYRYCLTIEC